MGAIDFDTSSSRAIARRTVLRSCNVVSAGSQGLRVSRNRPQHVDITILLEGFETGGHQPRADPKPKHSNSVVQNIRTVGAVRVRLRGWCRVSNRHRNKLSATVIRCKIDKQGYELHYEPS